MHLLDEAIDAKTPFRDISYPLDIRRSNLADLAYIRLHKSFPCPIAKLLAKIYGTFGRSYEQSSGEFIYVSKHSYAFIVPGEGCENACSYCCIKFAKQNPVSVSLDKVITAIKGAVDDGAKGVFVMPDDLGSWGKDLGQEWTTLVREICSIPGDFGLAFHNLHARDFVDDGEIFDEAAESRRLKFLGIMVQHVHKDALMRMNRKPFDVDKMIQRFKWLSQNGVHVLTHLIPGFPAETEEEFQEMLSFVRQVSQVAEVHLFTYERRDGTVAAEQLRHKELPAETIRRRYRLLLAELPRRFRGACTFPQALGKP